MLFDSMFTSLQDVLDLRSQQHSLTAANLANADTPGYRAKVIDFESALAARFDEGPTLALSGVHPLHLGGDGGPDSLPIQELEPMDGTTDGNSVLVERESVRLQENSLLYRAVSTGLNKRFAMLRYAANDGK